MIYKYYDINLNSSDDPNKFIVGENPYNSANVAISRMTDTIYVDDVLVQAGINPPRLIMYLTPRDDIYMLHKADGPAFSEIDAYNRWCGYFYYKGKNYCIEDMPIDNGDKLYLSLKYDEYDSNNYFGWYKNIGVILP